MRLSDWPEFRCVEHQQPLRSEAGDLSSATALSCALGCRINVVRGIPRFVDSANYAAAFGLQWKSFRKTQLDSYTGVTISRDRLSRRLGGSLEVLRGKSVLEVGCGAGRFTELMLAAGARVFACDLSNAVEANYENCNQPSNYFVCQADARKVPIAPHSFDYVICLGVLQHTPSPEETIAALAGYLKPGARLILDNYSDRYPQNFLRRNLRRVLIHLPPAVSKPLALACARALLGVHRLTWKNRRGLWRLRAPLLKHSPLFDYHDIFPELGDKLLGEWAILDTHDTLTDYYKNLRTREQTESALQSCGLTEISVDYVGMNVEASASGAQQKGAGV